MNKKTVFILGIFLTLTVSTLISFSMFRYAPFLMDSVALVYLVLLLVSGPGISLSFLYYVQGSFRTKEKPEVPLVSEDTIFKDLDHETLKDPDPLPGEPEVIEPSKAIVPMEKPGDAIKTVMQNRVIEALQKCKVEVNINAEMDLNGEFKDPKISVAFLTPETKKPQQPTSIPAQDGSQFERDPNKLQKPRV